MKEREEKFILSPSEVFQQDIIDRRIDFLVEKVNSLEQKVNKISEMLTEVLKRTEQSPTILEVSSSKKYGFESEPDLD